MNIFDAHKDGSISQLASFSCGFLRTGENRTIRKNIGHSVYVHQPGAGESANHLAPGT